MSTRYEVRNVIGAMEAGEPTSMSLWRIAEDQSEMLLLTFTGLVSKDKSVPIPEISHMIPAKQVANEIRELHEFISSSAFRYVQDAHRSMEDIANIRDWLREMIWVKRGNFIDNAAIKLSQIK